MGAVTASGSGMAGDHQLQRAVLTWGFVVSGLGAVVTILLAAASDVRWGTVGLTVAIAAVFGLQARRSRPRAGPPLVGVAAIVAAGGGMVFSPEVGAVAQGGLVVLLLVAVLVSSGPSFRQAVLGVGFLAFSVWWWQPSLNHDAIVTLLSVEASFILGYGAIAAVFAAFARSANRYQMLYRGAPVGLIEEDWDDALRLLTTRLGVGESIRDRLAADSHLLEDFIAAVRVVEVNEAAARIEGRSKEEMIGPVSELLRQEPDKRWWTESILAVSEGRSTPPVKISTTSADGRDQWLEVHAIVVEKPNRVLVTLSDVTEAEKARLALEREGITKDRFVAAISHELRTPLAAIVGFSHLLTSDRTLDHQEANEMMQFIADEANQVAWVVEDLLVTARADSGLLTVRPAACDLVAELETAMRDIPGVDLAGDAPGWGAIADAGRLRHVMRNLLLNAVEHGGSKRRAVVSVKGDVITLEVRDSGPPLSDEDLARIFSPYESAHNRPGLTASVGLGLSVARRLAQLMNGDLEYLHDGETVFRLSLPAIPLSSAGTRSQPSTLVVSVEPEPTERS